MATLFGNLRGLALLLGTAAATPVAGASESHTPQEARNLAVAQAAFERWRQGTGSPYDLLADDVRWTITGRSAASKEYPSREAFMAEVIRPFNARMREPLRPTLRQILADGEHVAIFFDAQGMARDGLPYVNTYAWLWRMRDGKIVEARAYYDSIAFDELWQRVRP
ncbi:MULTISPECIES: nuclear transport factor 2 family protein [Gammaproteobacteria]|uniref:nuclear transport factor 2 family protein n=1 Tax=Gammaproteobacteria TaxID=1236 RepID=UPI00112857C5|nr:nuclear transport factor 2 family protein [Pseudomonas sp. Hp2]